jgi:hypothetical protein
MISASEVASVAQAHLIDLMSWSDPNLKAWQEADIGEPLLVQTTECEPSFWIVPVTLGGRVLGEVEVGLDGGILGHSYFCRDPSDLSSCPSTVTRITAEEALRQAENYLKDYREKGMNISDPLFSHDGPRNRMGWMIEVKGKGAPKKQFFVTPGYVYERKSDEKLESLGLKG